ncbi:MAG: hypothetical protein VW378_01290 [bacterium]
MTFPLFLRYLIFIFLFVISFIHSSSILDISRLGVSSRSISVGRSTGFTQQAFNIFENPAGLSSMNHVNFSEFFTSTLDDEVSFVFSALAIPLSDGVIGFGWMKASSKDIIHTDISHSYPYEKSRFNYMDELFKIGYGFPLNFNLDFGLTFTYHRFSLGSFVTGTGYNLDFSAHYYLNSWAQFNFFVLNTLPSLKVNYDNNVSLSFPSKIKLNSKFSMDYYNFYSSLAYYFDYSSFDFGLGVDYQLPFFSYLVLGCGYSLTSPMGNLQHHFNVGFSLTLSGIDFSFCYEKSQYLVSPQQYFISFSVDF